MQNERNGAEKLMQINKNDKSVTKTIDTVTDRVVKYMIQHGITLSTAESCTGGMVSELITSVPGASNIFLGGACCYTEQIKQKILGVREETLEKYTVYSPQVASEMSEGAQKLFGSAAAIGITGVAGPGGAGRDRPAGTVFVSVRYKDKEIVRDLKIYELCTDPDRETVRRTSARLSLEMLLELCGTDTDKQG